jgi:site-specific DNA-methyltransferase (adenine-specific)
MDVSCDDSELQTGEIMLDLRNCDCMDMMKEFPDKYFDLVISDPPYGINHAEIAGKQSNKQYGKSAAPKKEYIAKDWDKKSPEKEYFIELFRVSKNQIIWGANYMTSHLPPSMGWIFWDKDNGTNGFSDGELAFSSFDRALRKYKYTWMGMIQGDMKNKECRIHPTQKPVALYRWLLKNYAKEGDKILDTHLGSGSIAIACHQMGFDLTASELDKDYFDAKKKRVDAEISQEILFELK